VTCFNCGKSHHLSKCPDPQDESRITRNLISKNNQQNAWISFVLPTVPVKQSESFILKPTVNKRTCETLPSKAGILSQLYPPVTLRHLP
jgi:hypothetical protein